ncbi:hypothetical protein POM88_002153 [Heracleum sosnowskyi]|uniref:Uncharacterized protein n=1 Tax=Heracleum sosnowskyi TaxID=360622 RepID=A0AAD8JEZ8_9APIA|nr:hypothetical protein POM88_002153 [Heracleum sosnowskyi]
MATTSSSMMEDVVQTWPSIEMLCKGHSMKQHFPKFWSSIQRYYESRAPQKVIPKLSPHDLHLKWRLASHKCKELSSIVMNFAPSIVSVSIFSGVKRYLDCSGYIID